MTITAEDHAGATLGRAGWGPAVAEHQRDHPVSNVDRLRRSAVLPESSSWLALFWPYNSSVRRQYPARVSASSSERLGRCGRRINLSGYNQCAYMCAYFLGRNSEDKMTRRKQRDIDK